MYERYYLNFREATIGIYEIQDYLIENGYTIGLSREYASGVPMIVLYAFEDEIDDVLKELKKRSIKYMHRKPVKNIPRQRRGKVEYI